MFKKYFYFCLVILATIFNNNIVIAQYYNSANDDSIPNQTSLGVLPTLPNYSIDHNAPVFNYVRVWSPSTRLTSIPNVWQPKVDMSTVYKNGFGNVLQSISHGGFGQKDIIKVNDLRQGKTSYSFLPYAELQDTKFRMNAFLDQSIYNDSKYPNEAGFNFSKSVKQVSNQTQYVHNYAAGISFVGNEKGSIEHVTFNDIYNPGDEVCVWNFDGPYGTPEINNFYSSDELIIKHSTADEHNPHIMSFYDKSGKLICKKVHDGTNWLVTYYVYDELGRISWIIPPTAIPTGSITLPHSLTNAVADGLCHHYKYDRFGQVIERKNPDRDSVERTVYDRMMKPVLYQNGILEEQGQWQFTIYDKKDRVAFTGIFTDPNNNGRQFWQDRVNEATGWPSSPQFEPLIDYLRNGVANGIMPLSISNCEINTYNYYDSYNNLPSIFQNRSYIPYTTNYINSPEAIPPYATGYVENLNVATQTRILDPNNSNNWISTIYYYNFEGQLIQTQAKNPWNTNDQWDVNTTQYDFSGNTILNINQHYSWTGADLASCLVQTKYVYNYEHSNLQSVLQKVDNGGWLSLAFYSYDDMGKVKNKVLGTVETQWYSYNIRGQLTGINDFYVYDILADNRVTFGEIIDYDFGFDNIRYDGKIAGYKYRGAGRYTNPRAYGYRYDAAGRMIAGDFYERLPPGSSPPTVPTPTWNKNTDYSAYDITYDANGNLQSLSQKGMAFTGGFVQPVDMDILSYTYKPNTNRLDYVTDAIGTNYNLHDFLDGNTSGADYQYDANGNLKNDLNKNITNITYNYMDLPITVVTSNGSTINNIYDASGNLLEKSIADVSTGLTEVERNWGTYLYKDDKFQLFLHDEGRTRWDQATNEFKNDFFIKDHLGNVRTVVNVEATMGSPYEYFAGFEIAHAQLEESVFDPIAPIRDNKPLGTPLDLMSGLLNGQASSTRIGAAILLHAMAGDQFNLNAYGYYEDEGPYNNYTMPEYMLSSLVESLTGATGEGGEGGSATTTINNLLTSTNYNMYDAIKLNVTDTSYPRTYLNYLVFDENYNLLPNECQLVQLKGGPNAWHQMQVPDIVTMQANGYILVYLSNESDINAWVDNESVTHYKGVLLEEQHYYPHGLHIEEAGQQTTPLLNNYLHQTKKLQRELGLELYDFHARQYDAQIGRFWGVDPMDQFPSGYTGMGNDPANLIDPTGMVAQGMGASDNLGDMRSYGGTNYDNGANYSDVDEESSLSSGQDELAANMENNPGGGTGGAEETDAEENSKQKNKEEVATGSINDYANGEHLVINNSPGTQVSKDENGQLVYKTLTNNCTDCHHLTSGESLQLALTLIPFPVSKLITLLPKAPIIPGVVLRGLNSNKEVEIGIRAASSSLKNLNGNSNRVSIRSQKAQYDFDLSGRPHHNKVNKIDIPTPHIKVSPRNFRSPGSVPRYNTKQSETGRMLNPVDIRIIRNYLNSIK